MLFRARGHQVQHADFTVVMVLHAQAAELAGGVAAVMRVGRGLLGGSGLDVRRHLAGASDLRGLDAAGAELDFTAVVGLIADDDLLLRGRAFVLGAIAVRDVRVAGVEAGKRFRSAGCGVQGGCGHGRGGNHRSQGHEAGTQFHGFLRLGLGSLKVG